MDDTRLQTGSDPTSTETVNIPTTNEAELLANGILLAEFLAGVIVVIVIVFAGIMYISSSGDAGRITKAKNMLLYAIVGLVLIITAFIITNFAVGRFTL